MYSRKIKLGKSLDALEIVDISIEDADWALLIDFLAEVDRLEESHILSDFSIHFSIHLGENTVSFTDSTIPTDDRIAAYLHGCRPFILKKERTYFYKICKVITKNVQLPQIECVVDRQKKLFSGESFFSTIQLYYGNIRLNDDNMVKKWLNSYEYHRDQNKRNDLDQAIEPYKINDIKPLFVSMVIDKMNAVRDIAQLVRVFSGQEKNIITLQSQSRK